MCQETLYPNILVEFLPVPKHVDVKKLLSYAIQYQTGGEDLAWDQIEVGVSPFAFRIQQDMELLENGN